MSSIDMIVNAVVNTLIIVVLSAVNGEEHRDQCWSLSPVSVTVTGYRNQSGHWISKVVVKGDQQKEDDGLESWQGDGCHVDVQHRPMSCSTGETSADIVLTFSVSPAPTNEDSAHLMASPTPPLAEAPESPPPRDSPVGYSPVEGMGHYRLGFASGNWSTAREACIQEGGDLAVIDTVEELKVVQQLGTRVWAWLGVKERGDNGVYFTVSDSVWERDFLKWWPRKPSYSGGSDCIVILTGDGRIGDTPCNYFARAYVCEQPWF